MDEQRVPWTRLGTVGAALAFSVLVVHVPAALWAGNAAELHVPISRILALGLAIAVAGTALFVIVLRQLPDRIQSLVAPLAGALGVIEWIYGLLLVGGMHVLDGVRSPLSSHQWFGLWELGVVVAVWLALGAVFRRGAGTAVLVLSVLNAGLCADAIEHVVAFDEPVHLLRQSGVPAGPSGSANPLFLYKPLRSRGPMRKEQAVVSLIDVGATLCVESSACTARFGVAVGLGPATRPRQFNNYVWQHRFWRTLNVPDITPYEVRGPLGRPDSWHRVP